MYRVNQAGLGLKIGYDSWHFEVDRDKMGLLDDVFDEGKCLGEIETRNVHN